MLFQRLLIEESVHIEYLNIHQKCWEIFKRLLKTKFHVCDKDCAKFIYITTLKYSSFVATGHKSQLREYHRVTDHFYLPQASHSCSKTLLCDIQFKM